MFLLRYADATAPTAKHALRDLAVRALLPALLVWAFVMTGGWLLTGPLAPSAGAENAMIRDVQLGRTPIMDTFTAAFSRAGDPAAMVVLGVVVVAALWFATKKWWFAIIPGLALALQASVFVAATLLIGRPRPEAMHLDEAPPTSSYPSGHVGASVALYFSLALMAQAIERTWLRRVVTVLLLAMPLLVSWSRFYRGMHHGSDIAIGALNGLACALIAWFWLSREHIARTGEAPIASDVDPRSRG